jgi:hypothetical protein
MRPAQFLLLAFIRATLAKVIHSYRLPRMPTLGFLFWILIWIGIAAILIFPDVTSFLTHLLGIDRDVDLIIYAILLLSFHLIFGCIWRSRTLNRRSRSCLERLL